VDVVQVAAFRWIQFNTAPPYISKFECIKWHKNIPVNCVSPKFKKIADVLWSLWREWMRLMWEIKSEKKS